MPFSCASVPGWHNRALPQLEKAATFLDILLNLFRPTFYTLASFRRKKLYSMSKNVAAFRAVVKEDVCLEDILGLSINPDDSEENKKNYI